MKAVSTYPLRLPRSLRAAVARVAREEGTSVNQFVSSAVAEKLAALEAVEFFESRKARADFAAFDRIMSRKGGEKPRAGDELDRK
ncbi:toxin-antitoxin system HicB family antitoxin [Fontimonas sp. SYSU GA230001]|uniref:toxin-antitoxin system HicB family antitoxin n=1 Tax=Fontimonas sp. SYSU GA230001 TaxID=3142450 RepID=UPI0032B4DB2B